MKWLSSANVLVGMFAAYWLFIAINLFGVDDDIDPARVAWVHEAVARLLEMSWFTVYFAIMSAYVNMGVASVITRERMKAAKYTLGIVLLQILIAMSSGCIGSAYFYITRPVGP